MPDETGDSKSAEEGEGKSPKPPSRPLTLRPDGSGERREEPPRPAHRQAGLGRAAHAVRSGVDAVRARLCGWVLVTEIAALCLWISLKGSRPSTRSRERGEERLGARVPRSAHVGHLRPRRAPHHAAKAASTPRFAGRADAAPRRRHQSVFAGLLFGRIWANVGVEYFSNS